MTIGKTVPVQTWKAGIKQGIVYGGISINYLGNGLVKILDDEYNFEMHPWDSTERIFRNIETIIADIVHGSGTSYLIHFRGFNKIE